MSYTPTGTITFADSANLDAFGRQRVSNPVTIFDSKQIFDNAPLLWDESLVSGAGITSAHSTATASTTITSTLNTAGNFVRQTFMSFNYQPGKSQLILMTGVLNNSGGGTGVERMIGQFNDDNGLFFYDDEGTVKVVCRTKTGGSVVDNAVAQTSWNVDPMDGTGPSGVTIDWTKTQIFSFDYEWLGVGRVRMGLNVNGQMYVVHEFLNANNLTEVYMSTPNLPLRYQMVTAATSAASSLKVICSSVQSEGGVSKLGVLRHADSGSVSGLSAGTSYALLGIRLKSGYIGISVLLETLSLIANTKNDQLHWELFLNPSVAGTFTYTDQTNSGVQIATGSSTNTISGGTELDGGYLETSLPVTATTPNALLLGAAIDGTVDEIVLVARPITNGITVNASLTWRELL